MAKRTSHNVGVVIVGAGGHGLVVADILRQSAAADAVSVLGFVDDAPALTGAEVGGLPVLGSIAALSSIPHDRVVVAIGDNALRRRLTSRVSQAGERVMSAIHPRSLLAGDVTMGAGSTISAGVMVTPGVSIGAGVILNTGAVIDHQCRIHDYAHIGPGAVIGANVTVEEGALVGIGATVRAGIHIGAGATIGAGAVVVRDIPAGVVAYGVPARVVRDATARDSFDQTSPGDRS